MTRLELITNLRLIDGVTRTTPPTTAELPLGYMCFGVVAGKPSIWGNYNGSVVDLVKEGQIQVEIVQDTGQSATAVISQKGTTDAIATISGLKVDKTTKIAGIDLQDDITADELKEELSIDKVDNTSDVDKPLSIAAQAALAGKADKTYVDTLISSVGDGSPKGTYATLTDLQTAYPTGTTGIYVVQADGHWYYWNGTAWTDGGQYQSTGIADDSILFDHLEPQLKDGYIKLENILINADFGNGTNGWSNSTNVASKTVNNGEVEILLANDVIGGLWQTISQSGIKYARFDIFCEDGINTIQLGNSTIANLSIEPSTWATYSATMDYSGIFRFYVKPGVSLKYKIRKPMIINLTELFGAGNEPSAQEMDEIIKNNGGWFNSYKIISPNYFTNLKVEEVNEIIDKDLFYTEHETALVKLENDNLKEEVEYLKNNVRAIYNAKSGKTTVDKEIINIRDNTTEQKLILHLHKRANLGYDTKNDVYLPNAEDDFSDIKITSDSGEVLPYRVIYQTKDFDIIADSRLGRYTGLIKTDSQNRMIATVGGYVSISEDNGVTWQNIVALKAIINPRTCLVTADDTLYFSGSGILYRSEYPYSSYTQVLDINDSYTDAAILSHSMVQHPDGEIFLGAYQTERIIRIYKSVDNGLTWTLNYSLPETYQHIHNMFIDLNQSPVAIYAGLDGGGGILKTTDKGATWTNLRETNPSIPQATDYGIIYSDPSGYRLAGGETSVIGGYSILKTDDDINFRPVLGAGTGIYFVKKLNGRLFAGGCGTSAFKSATIYMSEDEGESWRQIYTTSSLTDTAGTSDGFRYLSQGNYMGATEEQIIVGIQSLSRSPLRILPNGNYAEIIVDVPAGCNSIVIEDGYAYTNIHPIINDTKTTGEYLVKFNLNENSNVIKEEISGKYFRGDFEWAKTGKHLSGFYPYIISPKENWSILTKSLSGFKISNKFDTTDGITITFWALIGDENVKKIELFRTNTGDNLAISRYQLLFNSSQVSTYKPNRFLGWMTKYDIVINPDGTSSSYMNGHKVYDSPFNLTNVLTAIQNSTELIFLKTLSYEEGECLQYFSIRKGVVSAEQLYQEYNSFIKDNMGD